MAVDRLSIYNGSLRELGERRLASLSENREPRHVLDDAWNDGHGLLLYVLQAKQWMFGRRAVELTASGSVEPSIGFANAFEKPDDFIRTCKVCCDEYQRIPLLQYDVDNAFWYADIDPLYVTYISSSEDYGADLSSWPPNFVLWVETHLASLVANRITGSKANRNDLIKLAEMRLKKAASSDAMEDTTKFPPEGSWVRARRGGMSRYDRGSRSRLIG